MNFDGSSKLSKGLQITWNFSGENLMTTYFVVRFFLDEEIFPNMVKYLTVFMGEMMDNLLDKGSQRATFRIQNYFVCY